MPVQDKDFENPVSAANQAGLEQPGGQDTFSRLSEILGRAALRVRGDHKAVAAMDEAAARSALLESQKAETAFKVFTSGVEWLNQQPAEQRVESAVRLNMMLRPVLGPSFDMTDMISDEPSATSIVDYDLAPEYQGLLGGMFAGAKNFDDRMKVLNSPAYKERRDALNQLAASRRLPGMMSTFLSTPAGNEFAQAWRQLPEHERTVDALTGAIKDPRLLPPWLVSAIRNDENLQRKLGVVSPKRLEELEKNRSGGDFTKSVLDMVAKGVPLADAVEVGVATFPGTDQSIVERVSKLNPDEMARQMGGLKSAETVARFASTYAGLLRDNPEMDPNTALAAALPGGQVTATANVGDLSAATKSDLQQLRFTAETVSGDIPRAASLISPETVGIFGKVAGSLVPGVKGAISGAPFVPGELKTQLLGAVGKAFPPEQVDKAVELISTINGMIQNVSRLKQVTGDDRFAKYENDQAGIRADLMRGDVNAAKAKLRVLVQDVNAAVELFNKRLEKPKLEPLAPLVVPGLEAAKEEPQTVTLPDGTVLTIRPSRR